MICSILSLPQVRAASQTECDVCDTPIPAGAWFGVHECGAQICSSECLRATLPDFDDRRLRSLRDVLTDLRDDADRITGRLAVAEDEEQRRHHILRLNNIEMQSCDIESEIASREWELERAALEWLIHRVRFVKWRNVA